MHLPALHLSTRRSPRTLRGGLLLVCLVMLVPPTVGRSSAAAQAAQRSDAAAQAAQRSPPAASATLRQIIPGHFVYSNTNAGRVFSSGVVVTDEGALVVDALDSDALGQAEQAAILAATRQAVRYLVSSSF